MNKRTIIIKNDNNVDQKLYFPVRSFPCKAKLIPSENAYNVISAYCGNPICHLLYSYVILYSMESPPSLDCYRFFLFSRFLCNLHAILQTSHVGKHLKLCWFWKFCKSAIAEIFPFTSSKFANFNLISFHYVDFENIICPFETFVNNFFVDFENNAC